MNVIKPRRIHSARWLEFRHFDYDCQVAIHFNPFMT